VSESKLPIASNAPNVSLPVIPLGTPQTPPPAISKPVKVEVDGKAVEADARDNLIEAARRIGVSIPYFCYHPRLSIAGQCRMCLVETSDAPGRLVPGCQVRVKEGLKITTTSPAVRENQRGCMEFHLINHPVDCAICDQSGECKLQDYYMEYDHQATRIRTNKLNKPKRVELGPMVVYDGERCIMCTRCVRFMDEVAHEPQLAVANRGDHSLISTFPGQELDSQYSGNTVDICPVGALLNRDFRTHASSSERVSHRVGARRPR
jgi:NADH-quinone oxidoreductase subunit G